MVRCLVNRKACGGHRQERYGNTYGRMVNTTTSRLIGIVREFVKHCSWEESIIKEDVLGRGKEGRSDGDVQTGH